MARKKPPKAQANKLIRLTFGVLQAETLGEAANKSNCTPRTLIIDAAMEACASNNKLPTP
jgi:hypothetical protein